MMAVPTKIAFEQRYSDDSGVEFAVRFDSVRGEIQFEAVNQVEFPADELDWIIEALEAIRLIRNTP